MIEKEKDIWEIIAIVLRGNASPEDKNEFEKWLTENEENSRIFHYLSQIGYSGDVQLINASKTSVYNKIKDKMAINGYKKKILLWQTLAAASVVILLIASILLLSTNSPINGPSYVETKTPNGIRSSVKLADGSVVYLNSASTLHYPLIFTGKTREIELSGEAYFEVAHIPDRPFIVKAGSMQIKVLGTHFNIKAYQNESLVTTTLLEGKVEVIKENPKKNEKNYILMPNQQSVYNKNTGQLAVSTVDAGYYAIWRNDELFFERENFMEIAQKLERKFSVNIQIQSPALQNEQFSGHFKRVRSVIEVLDKMNLHRNFQYHLYRDTIRISKP